MTNPRIRQRRRPEEKAPTNIGFSRILFLAFVAVATSTHKHVQAFIHSSQFQRHYASADIVRVSPLFASKTQRRHPNGPRAKKTPSPGSTVTPPEGKTTSKPKREQKQKPKVAQRMTFSTKYKSLLKFYKKHGHSLVSSNDKDRELYKWTQSLRKNYKHQFTQVRPRKKGGRHKTDSNPKHKTRRPMLSESKIKLLEAVEFCWDVQEAQWNQKYKQLSEFFETYGHDSDVSIYAEDPALAIWLQNQRRDYRLWLQDLPNTLTPERLEALEELGVFDDYKTQDQAWKQYYQYLIEFHQEHGHSNVPQPYRHPITINVVDSDGHIQERHTTVALGEWCMNQRSRRRRWDTLQKEAENGDTIKNATKKGKKKKIDSNVKGIVNNERIRLLDALDFCWNYRETRWNSFVERLKEYHKVHGHLKIPTSDPANQDLRIWLNFQRHFYKRKRKNSQASPITEERIASLEEAIPDFSWKGTQSTGPSVEDWSNLFEAMRDKGIAPEARAKKHWFEGVNPFEMKVKSQWTEEELVDLFHQDDDDDEEDEDVSGGNFMFGDDNVGDDWDYLEELDSDEIREFAVDAFAK